MFEASADQLESFGLRVHRVFDEAPAEIARDTAHEMKHWMCLWALREFGEFLWVDWASVLPKDIENRDEFWWGDRVVQIWTEGDVEQVTERTYFAHVKHLEWAAHLRASGVPS